MLGFKGNTMATKFEPQECVIFVQSTKIGTHENKAIHSMHFLYFNAFIVDTPFCIFMLYLYAFFQFLCTLYILWMAHCSS